MGVYCLPMSLVWDATLKMETKLSTITGLTAVIMHAQSAAEYLTYLFVTSVEFL